MIKAIIYDMDGLLIDSEPIWREAEQRIFIKVGITLNDSLCKQTMGLRIDEVVNFWYEKSPWQEISKAAIQEEILAEVCQIIAQKGELLPGVWESLQYFKSSGLKLAIGTSSTLQVVDAVLARCGIRDFFDVIHSAEFEKYGKPHPAVFLSAAEKLNVLPTECLVLEDSFHGVVAALAAKMKVIAIPDKQQFKDVRFGAATLLLKSLKDYQRILAIV